MNAIDASRANALGLYLVDVESGDVSPIVRGGDPKEDGGDIGSPNWPAFSNDGIQIYYVDNRVIVAHDLDTHREREVHRTDAYIYRLALSPDGQTLAFLEAAEALRPTVLKTVPVAGGAPSELCSLEEGGRFCWGVGLSWTPDGGHVIVGGLEARDEPDELWCVPATGGDPRKLSLGVKVSHLSLHPDGRRIAITCRESGGGSELWAMENFLPEPAEER